MRIYISADIEGVAASMDWPETSAKEASYRAFADIMTKEVVAVCEGAFEGGATEIVVKDSHGSGNNIDVTQLPKGVKLIRGFSGHPYSMVEGIDKGFDAIMFVGYHSAAGIPGNPMSHTITGRTNYIKINGQFASEFMIFSMAAALENVPSILLSGDHMLCEMSRDTNPKLITVATKEGWGSVVMTKTPEAVNGELRKSACEAVKQNLADALVKLPESFVVEMNFKDHRHAYRHSFYSGIEQPEAKTLIYRTDNYFDVLRMFAYVL